ncbi:MAG: hypothetical protein VX209_03425 [Thermoproteota archaeon]|nr:hypothetical protein [Thermoproteota archaeon]
MVWEHHVKVFVSNSGKIKFLMQKNIRLDKKDVVGVRYGLAPMKFAAHAAK